VAGGVAQEGPHGGGVPVPGRGRDGAPTQPGGRLDRGGRQLGAGGVQRCRERGEREPVGAPGLRAQAGLGEERVDGLLEVRVGLVAGNARVWRVPEVGHRRMIARAADVAVAGNGQFPAERYVSEPDALAAHTGRLTLRAAELDPAPAAAAEFGDMFSLPAPEHPQ
jgi:hypothetical protein